MEKLVVNVTNRCNFKCGHCFREGATAEDLDIGLVESAIPDFQRVGIQQVNLTGGEPILHPRFADLLELFTRHGFRLGVVTNGWLADRYLETLAPYRPYVEFVAVSLDSHLRSEHDRLRRKGSFDRTVRAIDRFTAAGYAVPISHIVSTRTVDQLMAFGAFVKPKPRSVEVNLGRVVSTPGNGDWQLDAAGLRRLRIAAGLLRRQLGPRLRFTASLGLSRSLGFCGNFSSMDSVSLRFDGAVLFCCDSIASNRGAVLGNLRDEPFPRILARFGDALRPILTRRLAAIVEGRAGTCNDCDFCNATLAAEQLLQIQKCSASPADSSGGRA
jgi:MoaA/NifB/PqqE/SkfB family radical SAM enzyme